MLLWVVLAVMTFAVLAVLLRPLMGRSGAPPSDEAAAEAVYRDQLSQIEAECVRGLIGRLEAEAARAEIGRRLLAETAAGGARTAHASSASAGSIAFALIAILPFAAIAIYLMHGSPGRPAIPFAEQARAPISGRPVGELVARVEQRLRDHPEDGRGWDVIAPVYMRLERFDDAARAFGQAIRLLGETPARLAGFAEASVLASNGIVTEPARIAYERLGVLEPGRIEPRFWLAMAREQDGKLDQALAGYEALLTTAPSNAPWRPMVTERWQELRTRLGLPKADPPVGLAAVDAPPSPPQSPARGPGAADIEAAQRMSPEERRRMIEDMVTGLDRRLGENGRDLDGWTRLIRAYAVLGRREDALAALERARKALAGEAPALESLGALAKSLGLPS